jgi:hypothetical protein
MHCQIKNTRGGEKIKTGTFSRGENIFSVRVTCENVIRQVRRGREIACMGFIPKGMKKAFLL